MHKQNNMKYDFSSNNIYSFQKELYSSYEHKLTTTSSHLLSSRLKIGLWDSTDEGIEIEI